MVVPGRDKKTHGSWTNAASLRVVKVTLPLVVLAAACAGAGRSGSGAAASNGPSQPAPSAGAAESLSFESSQPSKPGRMQGDAIWQRATNLDPIALARLAEVEGTTGLLEGVRLGGGVGNVALRALAYAPDGELALGPLCAMTKRVSGNALDAVLAALLGIAEGVSPDTERIGAEGVRSCREILPSLAAPRATDEQRDMADAVVAQLAQLP